MLEILKVNQASPEDTTSRISSEIQDVLKKQEGNVSSIFVTGGRSTSYWMPALLKLKSQLNSSSFFLTDTFNRTKALAEGRKDTNEGTALDSGFATALAEQTLSLAQFCFADHRLRDPHEIARQLSRDLIQARGSATSDIVFLSAGGGLYRSGGPEDPGHVAGLPHGQAELVSDPAPFVVVNDMPKPPNIRITMSFELIKTASLVLLFVLGDTKRQALENVLQKKPIIECPASIVHHCPHAIVVTDINPQFGIN